MKLCPSPFCTFFTSVGPPSPASKIWHPLEFVPVKPCPDCLGSSWDPSTERPERQPHSSTAMFATKQARRPSLHETTSHLCFLSEACLYPRTSLMMLALGLMQGKLRSDQFLADLSSCTPSPKNNRRCRSRDNQAWVRSVSDPRVF